MYFRILFLLVHKYCIRKERKKIFNIYNYVDSTSSYCTVGSPQGDGIHEP